MEPTTMPAADFKRKMRKGGWTIKSLSKYAGVTMKRIREIRLAGVAGAHDVWGWDQLLGRRYGNGPVADPHTQN